MSSSSVNLVLSFWSGEVNKSQEKKDKEKEKKEKKEKKEAHASHAFMLVPSNRTVVIPHMDYCS